MKTGIELIAQERQRQIEVEGMTPEHDTQHKNGELALVAAYYAMDEQQRFDELSTNDDPNEPPTAFPWDKKWWKPSPENRIRELQKAGALIAAEIDRLQNDNIKSSLPLGAQETPTNESALFAKSTIS
jgi:hypothetical protein